MRACVRAWVCVCVCVWFNARVCLYVYMRERVAGEKSEDKVRGGREGRGERERGVGGWGWRVKTP